MSRSNSGNVEEKLHERYLALGFRDNTTQEVAFQELVQSQLSQIPRTNAQRRKSLAPDQNAEFVTSFLRAFGERLWPSKVPRRGHLSEPLIHSRRLRAKETTRLRYPVYSKDSQYTGANLRRLEKRMGRELNDEEKIVQSPLGKLFKLYADVAARVDVVEGRVDADAGALMDVILDARGRVDIDETGEGGEGESEAVSEDDVDNDELDEPEDDESGSEDEDEA